MTKVPFLMILCLLIGCGPNHQIQHIEMGKEAPKEISESFNIKVYEGSEDYSKVSKFLANLNATSCKNKVWDPPATKGDALAQLRLKAYRLGATALVDVYFDAKGTDAFGTNCWESVTVTGSAVVLEK